MDSVEAQHKLHNTTRPSNGMANEIGNKYDTKLLIHEDTIGKTNVQGIRSWGWRVDRLMFLTSNVTLIVSAALPFLIPYV